MIVFNFAMCKLFPGRTEPCDMTTLPACVCVCLTLLFPKSQKEKFGTRLEGVACAFQLFVIKHGSSDPASKELPHGRGIFPQQSVSVYSTIQISNPEPLGSSLPELLCCVCVCVFRVRGVFWTSTDACVCALVF